MSNTCVCVPVFDVLLCSRTVVLCFRNDAGEMRLKLADTFLKLGEIGMETGAASVTVLTSIYALCFLFNIIVRFIILTCTYVSFCGSLLQITCCV